MNNFLDTYTEFQIGNYAVDNSINATQFVIPNERVVSIDQRFLSFINEAGSNDFTPITLSIKWIERLGFKKASVEGQWPRIVYYQCKGYEILVDTEPVGTINDPFFFYGKKNQEDNAYGYKISFVNELQNHFRFRTGKELIVLNGLED